VSESVNPVLTKAEDLFETLAWKPLVEAEMTALGLNFFPVNVILRYIMGRVYGRFRKTADTSAIPLLNAEYQRAFNSAAVTLKIIARDKGVDSNEFKIAEENARLALSRLVRYNT
jgi:hypothetical protein